MKKIKNIISINQKDKEKKWGVNMEIKGEADQTLASMSGAIMILLGCCSFSWAITAFRDVTVPMSRLAMQTLNKKRF